MRLTFIRPILSLIPFFPFVPFLGRDKWEKQYGTGQQLNERKMNCNEANLISIVSFLHSLGIEPKRIVGRNVWYLSPIRNENTPSFKVDSNLNRWFDHGLGKGGKLIDLGILILNITVKDLLEKLDHNNPNKSFPFHKPNGTITSPTIRLVKALENPSLVKYLFSRSITLTTANRFCQEVHYSINGKNYFGIGFGNDSGGFEIRNPYFKGCLGSKGISTIIGNTDSFSLFEGFIDFLTAYQEGIVGDTDSIVVLNSVNQIQKAIIELQNNSAKRIQSYFDNDGAGVNCFNILQSSFPTAIDQSKYYKDFKDLNEMMCHKNKTVICQRL